jgi:hypothetical protein
VITSGAFRICKRCYRAGRDAKRDEGPRSDVAEVPDKPGVYVAQQSSSIFAPAPAPASPPAPANELEMTVARMESFNRRARQEATLLSNLEGILHGSDFLLQAEKQFAAAMAGAYVAGGTDAASPPLVSDCAICGGLVTFDGKEGDRIKPNCWGGRLGREK